MEPELRVSLLERLRYLSTRARRRMDLPGCRFCARETAAGAVLCPTHMAMLARLERPGLSREPSTGGALHAIGCPCASCSASRITDAWDPRMGEK